MLVILTGKERISKILKRQTVDRVGLFEEFWTDTRKAWHDGFDDAGAVILPNLKLDIEKAWPFDFTADVAFTPQIIEETDENILALDGNGATLRTHKLHVSTPEHVDFRCCSPEIWRMEYKSLLENVENRVNYTGYEISISNSIREKSFLLCSSWHVFQNMLNLCGHEILLMAMAESPDWVHDMVATFSKLSIQLHEMLFDKYGLPDGLYIMEDLGYKHSMFMSPSMFCEIIKPAYEEICSYSKNLGIPLFFHSCGYIEPIVPELIDVGIDCLTAMEVKAGMDVVKLFNNYGNQISFMGGVDTRALCTNDPVLIEAELQRMSPILKNGSGYILSSDHSIPDTVDYKTYCWFVERGLEMSRQII